MDGMSQLIASAYVAFNEGKSDEAEKIAIEVTKKSANSLDAFWILGNLRQRQGVLAEAAEWYKKATLVAKDCPEPYRELGHVLRALGDLTGASESYRHWFRLSPDNPSAQEHYAQTMMDSWLQTSFGRSVGGESRKTYARKIQSGFFSQYLSGSKILDIGFKGGDHNAQPILEHAVGIDIDYPGYDGFNLPFADGSQDAVYSSHCLEHVPNLTATIQEWFRVIRQGGFMVTVVPHQFLYEKRHNPPSRWNGSHYHFFTPAKLLAAFEAALPPNHYRVRHLCDNDFFFNYALNPLVHSTGCYEIELVLEKIAPPSWELMSD